MKICPYCQIVYADDMNYCLEHGVDLIDQAEYDRDKTISRSDMPTEEYRGIPTGDASRVTRQPDPAGFTYPVDQPSRSYVFPVIAAGLALLFLVGAAVSGAIYIKHRRDIAALATPTPIPTKWPPSSPRTGTPTPTPEDDTPKLKVESGAQVDGSFGSKYLQCMVTNISDELVVAPKVRVTYYENDIKVDTATDNSELKFLKPGESKPVWVRLPFQKTFNKTIAEADKPVPWLKDQDGDIFPDVAMTDVAMTIEKKTSMYNFRRYQENFYMIDGILENMEGAKITPKVFITYLDDKSQVVGYASATSVEIAPGQKGKFSAQAGRSEIFGVPVKFEAVVYTGR